MMVLASEREGQHTVLGESEAGRWLGALRSQGRREEGQAKGKHLAAGKEAEGQGQSMIGQALGSLGCVLALY